MKTGPICVISILLNILAWAGAPPLPDAPQPQTNQQNKRILFIVPAYDVTAADAPYHPLSAHEKLNLFAKNTLDPWTVVKAAADAGIGQAADRPHYEQGGKGYAERFGAAVADSASMDFFSRFAFPALLRQDPRYFRLGSGSGGGHRFLYALDRVLVTRNDSGRNAPNFSLILGGAAATALSNAYYPARDQTAGYTLVRFGERMAVEGGVNVLKEFWPGIRTALHRKNSQPSP